MVPVEQVVAVEEELTAAGADWQIHTYGHTMHAFTNPQANDPDLGTVYEPKADRRSWQSLKNFLEEIFE
jgi:dienelactone hydrolase